MRDQSLSAGVGRPDQYVTVYSGMETAPFLNPPVPREVVRQQLGLRDGQIVVGTIARLFHLKGHDDLIDIAPQLCAKFPNLRFLWIGDGLLRENFESRISQLGLSDRFILTGLVPPTKIPELANAMDILVHPSRREGLARALPQGALCGLPAVTYDIDGAKEGVLDGESGYVLPPFDREKLADAITKLAADPALRNSMGSAGRKFALDRFDASVMVDALQRVYEEVQKRKRIAH
jgi:glycosyltransferase involved in cell wall biosynthesis